MCPPPPSLPSLEKEKKNGMTSHLFPSSSPCPAGHAHRMPGLSSPPPRWRLLKFTCCMPVTHPFHTYSPKHKHTHTLKRGVPGMVASLLGAADVILTEQDELLSLLQRNLASNFPDGWDREGGGRGGGARSGRQIRCAPLDWERDSDIQKLMASPLLPEPLQRELRGREVAGTTGSCSKQGVDAGADGAADAAGSTTECEGGVSQGGGDMSSFPASSMHTRQWQGPDWVLCADCVYEPLYGDSWKALARVLRKLCGGGSGWNGGRSGAARALVAVERRNHDGVPDFLEACGVEGLEVVMVFKAGEGAPAPVELYEMSSSRIAAGKTRAKVMAH
ncbi:unnamed protein product [Discosporangium mesarthrocarpum]